MNFHGFSTSTLPPGPRPGSRTAQENYQKASTQQVRKIMFCFLLFLCFFGAPRRATEKLPNIPPQSLPRALWGPPRESEIDQLCASGGARRPTNNLFWLPGPSPGVIWRFPGGRLGPTWRPEAPRRAPGLHFRSSGASLGSIFLRFSCFFAWCSSCFTAPFGLRGRLRARLRALPFAAFK